MHSVIREDDPKFDNIKTKVDEVKPRIQFRKVASDIKDLIVNHRGKGHVVIEYAHEQISNVVYALKRHGLVKDVDYSLTRCTEKSQTDPFGKVEQIIITPIVGSHFKTETEIQ